MTQIPNPKQGGGDSSGAGHGYDLAERCAVFGESVIGFAKGVGTTPVTMSLISQLVRAATSIGANYGEADDAESRKDFRHKVGICRKESKECKHWLRMMGAAVPEKKDEIRNSNECSRFEGRMTKRGGVTRAKAQATGDAAAVGAALLRDLDIGYSSLIRISNFVIRI
jgi:four helix bundle protein